MDSDPTAITAEGFTLSVEEVERVGGIHGIGKVDRIAVVSGGRGSAGTASNTRSVTSDRDTLSLGASFEQPIVLAET